MQWESKMTSNEYVKNVINKYKLPDIDLYTQIYIINPLVNSIREWGGDYINEIKISGSRAKGTAITLASDLDLFISIKNDCNNTLKEIFYSLYSWFESRVTSIRKQNVSIGLNFLGRKIDVIPGKKQPQNNTNYHSLYKNKTNSWTQTNIDLHINKIIDSGRIDEIVAIKIWRELHKLEFPSIYLELVVLEALKGKSKNDLANNVWEVLRYLRDDFKDRQVIDPANSNNIISDDLYDYEKDNIAKQAKISRNAKNWNEVIW